MENLLSSRCFLEIKGVGDILAIYKKNSPSTSTNHIISPFSFHFATNTHTKTNTTTTLYDIISDDIYKGKTKQIS